jgi:hypothetical protein
VSDTRRREAHGGQALYVYGETFESRKEALAGFLKSYQWCEQARLVQLA